LILTINNLKELLTSQIELNSLDLPNVVNLHHKDLRAVASKLSKILIVFYYDLQMTRFRIFRPFASSFLLLKNYRFS